MRTIDADLGVAAIVVQDEGILLVQEGQGKHKEFWGLPKGFVESGELPANAVIRELYEECGLSGTVTGLIGIRETLRDSNPCVFIAYRVRVQNNNLSINSSEISAARFFGLDELSDLKWISSAMHLLAKSGLEANDSTSLIDFTSTQNHPYLVHLCGEVQPA
tara:strand:- start:48 stop:533 length:486 start_codon:yes stop_codon:yes gene_type:complete